jgi:exonuclease SbcC
MIPQRILVKGFLSYRDEQEVTFDGDSLWMLTGPNGSGKSTVFDAVTYALFGQHRGGKQNAKELINKDSDGLVVEFDFSLDGQLYRAHRTLKKKSNHSTRQIHHWVPAMAPGGKGKWEAVLDTGSDRGFTEWVREHIGLTYETFTSSVLLLQGKAEKLLGAEPAERFRVLAGIVDLGRYQRLHERADTKRRELEATARSVQQQLDALPEVSDEELQEVDCRITAADAAKREAQAEVERLQRLEVQAERWAELQARRLETQQQWDHAQDLLNQAAVLEQAWERLTDLRLALPHLESVVRGRNRLHEAMQLSEQLTAQRRELTVRLDQLDQALEQTRQQRDARRQAIIEDEDRQEALGIRLRELSGLLARVALCKQQRDELTRLEAQQAQLPAHLPETLQKLAQEHTRLESLHQALPQLRRLHTERNELHQARERSRSATEAEQAASMQVEHLTIVQTELAQKGESAIPAHAQAREQATEARTLLKEATDALDEFDQLAGAKICRHCGQPLTPNHYVLEKKRRAREKTEAEARYRQAEEVRQTAARAEKTLLGQKKEVDDRLEESREQAREHHRRRQQADRDGQRHVCECTQTYRDLAEPFRSLVSAVSPDDWLATTYPTASDLEDAQRQVQNLAAVRRQVQETKMVHDQWNDLQMRIAALRQTLTGQEAELPDDIPAFHQQHAQLEAEEKDLRTRLSTQRARVRQEQDDLDRLTEERQGLSQQLAAKDRQLDEQKLRCQSNREAIAAACGFLPSRWQAMAETATMEQLQTCQAERQELEDRGIEAQVRDLQGVRSGLETLRQRRAELEREQDEIPEEGRCDPTQLRKRIVAAKQELTARDLVLGQVRQEGLRLADRREQRQQLQQQFRDVDRRQTLYRTLVEQLGRRGLQLHLMRQAESGIIDFANTVLDRLSGGQFCLRLRGADDGDTDQALQLEAYDRQRDQVFGLPFLSGSQRFRVAVSLALGIGQYASRQHRPIESVIIDEGFGCLDREGRQVMIQEMQNLRNQLRCILLVSHQEEFADAFAEGYRFTLSNGTTAVTRFQR